MPDLSSPVWAAIDIGSNTLRIVIARSVQARLEVLASDEVLVRIGESVNASGEISSAKFDEVVSVLKAFLAFAQEYRASVILAVATEAIRSAANAQAVLADIQRLLGLTVHCIDGSDEALLTFYGVASGSDFLRVVEPLLVMDLGGGSTELIFSRQMHISENMSLPIGSGWLSDRYFFSDPPSADDIVTARTFVQNYLAGVHFVSSPSRFFVTGGSANTLLSLARQIFLLDPVLHVMNLDIVIKCEKVLSSLSAYEIAERYAIDVKRARILMAGVIIIRAVMETFHLKVCHIRAEGIREGLLVAYDLYGKNWLQRIHGIAQLSARLNPVQLTYSHPVRLDAFYEAGRKMLHVRARKMVACCDAVLKRDDVEAVHRMRVASRRLRAVLDAYRVLCAPRPFRKSYRVVKRIADVLGDARDTDVMIERLLQRAELSSEAEVAGIQWFITQLKAYRVQQQGRLEICLQAFDRDAFLHDIDACLPT